MMRKQLDFNIKKLYPAAWFDASKPESVILSSGSVSRWLDTSGNNRHLTSPAGQLPQYVNSQYLFFNTISSGMIGDYGGSILLNQQSIFMVMNVIGATGQYARFFTQTSTGKRDYINPTFIPFHRPSNQGIISAYTQSAFSPQFNYSTGQVIAGIIHYGNRVIASKNGVESSPYAHTLNYTVNNFAIGQSTLADNSSLEYINAYVHEILVFFRDLSTTERLKVEGYLASKWGMSNLLANDHPYKYNKR